MFCKFKKKGETNRILKILTNKNYNKDERLKNEFKMMMLRSEFN